MSASRRYRIATEVAHVGRDPRRFLGAVNTPVFRASTILFDTMAELEQATRGELPGVTYGLHGLPTVSDLAAALARLEGGHAALVLHFSAIFPRGIRGNAAPVFQVNNVAKDKRRQQNQR